VLYSRISEGNIEMGLPEIFRRHDRKKDTDLLFTHIVETFQ